MRKGQRAGEVQGRVSRRIGSDLFNVLAYRVELALPMPHITDDMNEARREKLRAGNGPFGGIGTDLNIENHLAIINQAIRQAQ